MIYRVECREIVVDSKGAYSSAWFKDRKYKRGKAAFARAFQCSLQVKKTYDVTLYIESRIIIED